MKKEYHRIPKIIHFIWVGPDTLPAAALDNIADWATRNPHHEIFFWTDRSFWQGKTDKEKQENLFTFYHQQFAKQGIEVFNEVIKDAEKKQNYAPVIIKDIIENGLLDENQLLSEHVQYELHERIDFNPGSASDMLRYKILIEYGGKYYDCQDVYPGTLSLDDWHQAEDLSCGIMDSDKKGAIDRIFDAPTIILDHKSQDPEPTAKDLQDTPENLPVGNIGNDSFMTTINHPFWKSIIAKIANNYDLNFPKEYQFEQDLVFEFLTQLAYSSVFRLNTTIYLTGPRLISCELQDESLGTPIIMGPGEYIKSNKDHFLCFYPLRTKDYFLMQPAEHNNLAWMYKKELKCNNKDQALTQTLKAIQFEYKHFHMLRLEDHIRLLAKSSGISNQEAIAILIPKLDELNFIFSTIKMVQLTYVFNKVEEFYSKHDLLEVSYSSLEDEKCYLIIHWASNLDFFERLFVNTKKDITGYTEADIYFNKLSYNQLEQMLDTVIRNFYFIKQLFGRLDKNKATPQIQENLTRCQHALICFSNIIVYLVDIFTDKKDELQEKFKEFKELSDEIKDHLEHVANLIPTQHSPRFFSSKKDKEPKTGEETKNRSNYSK